jgi:hypothetical protein
MHELHLTADAAVALGLWLATTAVVELVVKPLLFRLYRRADEALKDFLPDIP